MLTKIHVAQGIEKSKARARQIFYWPGINNEIENMVKSCRVCEKFSSKDRREPLNVYELPKRPWQRLAADIFSYGDHSFLVVMDTYSNWLEVVKIQSKSTEEVIRKFMSIFSKFACPDTLICDNIPSGSEKMKAFVREWNFNIVTRSANCPRSNGLEETAAGIAKKTVKQSMDTNKDMYSMLMEYRNCPLKQDQITSYSRTPYAKDTPKCKRKVKEEAGVWTKVL
ncbi:Integrase zinc binding domain [Popillia japonica]|uniref:RNA-directed DNA polymerase n=1 Tax=Popillia japonica TaxID=7064 RepID=A0AAW1MMB2_POPJA